MLDIIIRKGLLERCLPDWLKAAADGLENSITGKSDGTVATINYGLTNPILHFINTKLSEFLVILDEPKRETDEPVPDDLKEKLGSVVKELMALAKDKLSGNGATQEGLRDGLIEGGYLLLKFWQGQQEVLLKSILELTVNSLYPADDSHSVTLAPEEKEHNQLLEDQREIVGKISSKIIDVTVKQIAVGAPASQVNYHWYTNYNRIRSYLEEGLADTVGIQKAFKEDNANTVLNKHWVFWEGFLSLMKEATKQHYPEQAREMLMKEFYPLCESASKQLELIKHLQEEQILCSNHEKLKVLFVGAYFELMQPLADNQYGPKEPETIDVAKLQDLLKKIAVLFPSGNDKPKEVIVLETYLGKLEELRALEKTNKALRVKQLDLGADADTFRLELDAVKKDLKGSNEMLMKEQLQLLRTINLGLKAEEFKSPMSFTTFIEKLGEWIQEKANGYHTLQEQNFAKFKTEAQKLKGQNTELLAQVRKMKPAKLHNVLEESYDRAEKWPTEGILYRLGRAAINYFAKAPLQKDFDAVLGGVRRLINAEKTAPGQKNLYVAAERKLLEEVLKYYKTRPATG
jgi:hypothetical protein